MIFSGVNFLRFVPVVMRWIVPIILTCFFALQAHAAKVAYVCAGFASEEYWRAAVGAMQSAADDLGWELEVYYADREPLRQITLVAELLENNRPDYLMISGERGVLVEQLRLANAAKVPTLLVFNSVQALEREVLAYPRVRVEYWLGSLAPMAEEGGYISAKALIQQAKAHGLQDEQGRLEMVALYGDRSTHSSIARNEGLKRALHEHPEVIFHQGVSSEWSRSKAHFQTTHLLKRYPNLKMIWGGSDQLTFGAMQAAQEAGGSVGESIVFSGMNTSNEALEAVRSGRLAVLAGGHFMAGAWGLVMLYDYHHGIDFADTEGLELERSMFTLLDAEKAGRLQKRDLKTIDFHRFSKVHNPTLERYNFSFDAFLRGYP